MNTYLKLIVMTVVVMYSITSCYNKYSRKDPSRTTKLNDRLYIETYIVSGQGAFGTDMVSQYITDSSSFRKYVGTFDEGPEFHYYRVSADTVYIEKYLATEGKEPKKLLSEKFLTIPDLKKLDNYR